MYTFERAAIVRDRVQAGERITAVCRDLGMDHSNFCRWCRRNGFRIHTPASRAQVARQPKGPYPIGEKVPHPRQPRPDGRAAAIAADLRQGLPPKLIAAQRGVTYVYVIRLRKLVGLNPPAGPGRNIVGSPRKRKAHEAICNDLRAGMRVVDIAARHGLTPSRIYQIKARIAQTDPPPHRAPADPKTV